MPWSLRVITGLTADTEPSLILKFESPPAKYIFNVPEGTNRACIQKRYGIAKTKAAFLTRLHPEQIGGFPGLVMMLADINSRDLTVCGPAGLTHYIASTRFYARRTAFGVNVNEYKHHDLSAAGNATLATLPPPIFQDENIVVHSIALYPSAVDDTGSTGSPSGSRPDLPPKTSILALDTEVSMHPRLDPAPARFVPSDDFKATLEAINAGSYVHPLEDIYTSARKDAESSSPSHLPANPNGQDITITALGTVSATLIQIPSYGNILLDSGEGTWGQLARQFGQPIISEEGQASGGVIDILRDLKCIFISHVHGDHHMGLAKILARRHQLNPSLSEPLYLIANRLTLHYLSELNDVVDFGFHDRRHVSVVDAEDVYYLNGPAKLKATLGLESIQTVDVEHRTQCYGLVLRHKDEWSVVYSGDTMPCTRLVEAGQDATVLIHEATMADDQVDLALAKAHSTAGQAIDRYPKMPELQGPALADESLTSPSEEPRAPVAIAFDCATLRLGSLWKMEKYMGAMAQTFEKEPDEASDGGVPLDGTEAPATSSSPSKGKKNKKEKRSEAKTA
ncbi:hypothetical protein FRC01_006582 [Tulasnella sp. 417]|nr:hypothetical protein FRC01_006582 [Tulasnella sp. 417]